MASDYIFIRKSRNAVSNVLHALLNILLGVGSIFATIVSGSWIIGFILVLLSKWRMFAFCSGTSLLPVHYILSVVYVLWLTVVKPRTTEIWNRIQALTAIFLGSCAIFIMCASLNSALPALLEFIVGYGAARHVLAQNNNMSDSGYPALIFGVFFAEIALLAHSWMIVYAFMNLGVIIPQPAIILTIFGFMIERIFHAIEERDGTLRFKDIALPVSFGLAILAIVIIGFSEPIFNV